MRTAITVTNVALINHHNASLITGLSDFSDTMTVSIKILARLTGH